MLADLGAVLGNETGDLWQMRNGYALPRKGGLQKVAQRIAAGDRATLRGLVRVGVQGDTQVTLPGAKHVVTQIYASALPIAYAEAAVADWEPFARLVLEAAYLATLAAAVQSKASRVFLTRLGGGAFGNPPDWITQAMGMALQAWASADLEVFLVSYDRPNPANRVLLGS